MAKITKRAIKRNKAKAKNEKSTDGNSQRAVTFNAKHETVKAAIAYGTSHATTDASKAMIEQFRLGIIACKAGAMLPKHNGELMEAINASVVAKRKAMGITVDYENNASWATRKSEAASILKLYEFECALKLFATLHAIGYVTFEGLYNISKWMRDGAWDKSVKTAPTHDDLASLLKAKKKAKSKRQRRGRKGSATVVGMPGDAVRGLAHVLKCAKAFDKAHARHFTSASDRKMFAACIDNINSCFKPTRALVASREAEAAAKAAK